MAQVIAEYNTAGTIIASYTYADDLIRMTKGGQTYYYHFDGLGSTRLLTNASGTITDTYSYDAFGNIIAKIGTTENTFLFTGQQYDANIGFYYQRARYYQPTIGRFTAYDPIEGDIYTPISLHKYLYAADDPVNKIDPSGEMAVVELLTVVSIIEIILLIEVFRMKKTDKVEYCKRDLDAGGMWGIPITGLLSYIIPNAQHAFLRITRGSISSTYGFTTLEPEFFKSKCVIEGPGIVQEDYKIDQKAASGNYKNGICSEKSCKNPLALLLNVQSEKSGTKEKYCFSGFNCQEWAKKKLNEYCE